MLKIKLHQLFFKCCFKIDKNNKGYMFNGKYIECISQHCWALFYQWSKNKTAANRNLLVEIFADIKRKQSQNWDIFLFNPKRTHWTFKDDFFMELTEIEPIERCTAYRFNGTIIYESWQKK